MAKKTSKTTATRSARTDLSKALKQLAAEQPIQVRLTDEQMQALLKNWDQGDPKSPAQITFFVGERPVAEMTVAAYRYRGDTCCV